MAIIVGGGNRGGGVILGAGKVNPLDSHGVIELKNDADPRLILMTSGEEKRGKTHYACGLPDPILTICFGDTGTVPTMHKVAVAQMGKKVKIRSFPNVMDLSNQTLAASEWAKVCSLVDAVVNSTRSEVRSVFIDQGTTMWELLRMAKFGKLTKVMPHQYTIVNSEMERVWGVLTSRPDLHIIATHRHKKKYVNDSWNGRDMEFAGYSGMPYIANVVGVHTRYVEGDGTVTFGLRITEARDEPQDLLGYEFKSNPNRTEEYGGPVDECNYPTLFKSAFPDAEVDW